MGIIKKTAWGDWWLKQGGREGGGQGVNCHRLVARSGHREKGREAKSLDAREKWGGYKWSHPYKTANSRGVTLDIIVHVLLHACHTTAPHADICSWKTLTIQTPSQYQSWNTGLFWNFRLMVRVLGWGLWCVSTPSACIYKNAGNFGSVIYNTWFTV